VVLFRKQGFHDMRGCLARPRRTQEIGLLGVMDRGLIGSKERQKAEEPFVAFEAAEGADKQKEMEKGFARS
jgi:hypothetical protein